MPRLLLTPTHSAAPPPPVPMQVDSDVVVILAALLCALICVVGLSLVARCAWLRRSISTSPPPPPNKGLKKKVVQSFPKLAFDGSPAATGGGRLVECVICLAEFVEGDVIRILPQCGHGFHVGCVDTWLGSHSSCPSCRRVPVVVTPDSRCSSCGAAAESDAKAREDGDDRNIYVSLRNLGVSIGSCFLRLDYWFQTAAE